MLSGTSVLYRSPKFILPNFVKFLICHLASHILTNAQVHSFFAQGLGKVPPTGLVKGMVDCLGKVRLGKSIKSIKY